MEIENIIKRMKKKIQKLREKQKKMPVAVQLRVEDTIKLMEKELAELIRWAKK